MTFFDRIELFICTYSHSVIVVETPRLVSLKSRRFPVWSLGVCLLGFQVLILHKTLGNVELGNSALLNLENFLFLGLEQAPKSAV